MVLAIREKEGKWLLEIQETFQFDEFSELKEVLDNMLIRKKAYGRVTVK